MDTSSAVSTKTTGVSAKEAPKIENDAITKHDNDESEEEEEDITIAPQPSQLVPVRNDWFHCDEGLNFQCRMTLALLGLRDQDVSCTIVKDSSNSSWVAKISLVPHLCLTEEEIESSAGRSDLLSSKELMTVPPPKGQEKVKNEETSASVVISKTGAKLTCRCASLRKIFEHIGHALPQGALSGLKRIFEKISEVDTKVSLDADIQFENPPKIHVDLFEVNVGEWLHLKMVTKMVPQPKPSAASPKPSDATPPLPAPEEPNTEPTAETTAEKTETTATTKVAEKQETLRQFCFEGKIRIRMGQVVNFVDTLGFQIAAGVLKRVTQSGILVLSDRSLFRLSFELDVGGGEGFQMKRLDIAAQGIHLFGLPMTIASTFTLGDDVHLSELRLTLAKPNVKRAIPEKPPTLWSVIHSLNLQPPEWVVEILQKFELSEIGFGTGTEFQPRLHFNATIGFQSRISLSLSFHTTKIRHVALVFFAFTSFKVEGKYVHCNAALWHLRTRTYIKIAFNNLTLSDIMGPSFHYDGVQLYLNCFEWVYGAPLPQDEDVSFFPSPPKNLTTSTDKATKVDATTSSSSSSGANTTTTEKTAPPDHTGE
ncbi:hypothetical protein Pelo_10360 [Pelomyxa schiedti]|nr:hypothetical protein Pelo_10360 [Pelomyxa schiedti]